jgi:hypothetical protein
MNESWRVIYGLQAVLQKLSIAVWLRAHGKFVRPELTVKQRQELKECFELIDADGSGGYFRIIEKFIYLFSDISTQAYNAYHFVYVGGMYLICN